MRHLLEILGEDMRPEVAAAVRRPLTGLKVACYYGCLLSRPPEVTQFDDAENPTLMDRLLETAGATVGRLAAQDRVLRGELLHHRPEHRPRPHRPILAMAQAAGVDCIATACPLCQLNLDMRQKDIAAKRGRRYDLPVFYFTQLLGLAMGCSESELSLEQPVRRPAAAAASPRGSRGARAQPLRCSS